MFKALSVLTLNIFLSASWYRNPISVIMYVYMHPNRTYSSSPSFGLQHHMAGHRVRSVGPRECEETVVYVVQV